jgi:hypothetical protein
VRSAAPAGARRSGLEAPAAARGLRSQRREEYRQPVGSNPVRSTPKEGDAMLLIREIMYCKPGKVRPLLEKFMAMAKLTERAGMGKMRVLTDVSGERYWTLVSEMEVPSLEAFQKMMAGEGTNEKDLKEMEALMKGYHDLVDHGRREIYKIEM